MLRRHDEKSVRYADYTWDSWSFDIDPAKEKSDPDHRMKRFFSNHTIASNGATMHSNAAAAAWLLKFGVAKKGVTQPQLEAALAVEHERVYGLSHDYHDASSEDELAVPTGDAEARQGGGEPSSQAAAGAVTGGVTPTPSVAAATAGGGFGAVGGGFGFSGGDGGGIGPGGGIAVPAAATAAQVSTAAPRVRLRLRRPLDPTSDAPSAVAVAAAPAAAPAVVPTPPAGSGGPSGVAAVAAVPAAATAAGVPTPPPGGGGPSVPAMSSTNFAGGGIGGGGFGAVGGGLGLSGGGFGFSGGGGGGGIGLGGGIAEPAAATAAGVPTPPPGGGGPSVPAVSSTDFGAVDMDINMSMDIKQTVGYHPSSAEFGGVHRQVEQMFGAGGTSAAGVTLTVVKRVEDGAAAALHDFTRHEQERHMPTAQKVTNSVHVLHGSSRASIESIVANGFEVGRPSINGNMYGRGIYTTCAVGAARTPHPPTNPRHASRNSLPSPTPAAQTSACNSTHNLPHPHIFAGPAGNGPSAMRVTPF